LSLKLLYGHAAGKSVDHFARERDVLLSQIRARTLNGSWFEQVLALAAVNAALWQAEDALRTWRNEPEGKGNIDNYDEAAQESIARLAFTIQDLNDQRADLVAAINTQTGERDGAEKL
jgi:hypothetical protein